MPTLVRCGGCGEQLREWSELPNGSLQPSQIWYDKLYSQLNGKCPKCGHSLPSPRQLLDKMKVDIKPAPGTEKMASLVGAFKHDYHKR